jgi:hypothetical protein
MDYIFYRMYRWHKEKKWTPTPESHATGFIGAIHFVYIIMFSIAICNLFFRANFGTVLPCLFFGTGTIDMILLSKRYNDKRIAVLLRKYKKDWRNKIISKWFILMTFPLSFPCAIFLTRILFAGQIRILGYEFTGLLGWLIEKFGS